jgi:hypothetical protein
MTVHTAAPPAAAHWARCNRSSAESRLSPSTHEQHMPVLTELSLLCAHTTRLALIAVTRHLVLGGVRITWDGRPRVLLEIDVRFTVAFPTMNVRVLDRSTMTVAHGTVTAVSKRLTHRHQQSSLHGDEGTGSADNQPRDTGTPDRSGKAGHALNRPRELRLRTGSRLPVTTANGHKTSDSKICAAYVVVSTWVSDDAAGTPRNCSSVDGVAQQEAGAGQTESQAQSRSGRRASQTESQGPCRREAQSQSCSAEERQAPKSHPLRAPLPR